MSPRFALLFPALLWAVAFANVKDPPDRVARVSYILGSAKVLSANSDAGDLAAVNWPVSSGDRVHTDAQSSAEIDLGAAKLRLDQDTDLIVLQFDSQTAHVRIGAGTVSVQVREPTTNPVTIQVDHASVALREPGEYRIDVAEGAATVIVRSGVAQISAGPARFQETTGEAAQIATDGTVAVVEAPGVDEFDRWSERRTQHAGGERAALHVPKGLVGYEDLDAYGTWRWEPEYGMVWQPRRVSRDWAPYRFGQWIWKSPWGRTWVDDAPWGFAPFHSGRWLQLETGWVWLPGPRQIPPVYAPALVSWSADPHARNGLRWEPLGPGERYVPPYPASDLHTRRLNLFATVDSPDKRRVSAR
jgi:hypothetical protein